MKKYLLLPVLAAAIGMATASAQVSIGVGVGPRYGYGYGGFSGGAYRRYPPRKQQKDSNQPKFDPIIHFSLGYGYPNLDKAQMASYYNYYLGNTSQNGPITGAIDYQYSANASIGLMVTHGQISGSYYDYNNPGGPAVMSGSLDNWSVMLNLMNYMGYGQKLTPYFRTAIGLNIWNQQYTDASGNKLGPVSDPNQLAYQVSLGARIDLSKNTGLFMEAGYGKYILHGGLTFRL